MNFFIQNLFKRHDISNELPSVHIDADGIIVQANQLFKHHFPCSKNSKISDIIELRQIDQINFCIKNGYKWKVIDEQNGKNYILYLIPQLDITPDLWNILTIPMLLVDKDGYIIKSNKAYDIQFNKPQHEFIGKYCSGLKLNMIKPYLIKDLIWDKKRSKITFYQVDNSSWILMVEIIIQTINQESNAKQIMSSVVHDFRNILTVLKGYSDLVIEDLQISYIIKMQETIDRATNMVNQLLRFSRSNEVIYTKINDVILNIKEVLIKLLGDKIKLQLDIRDDIAHVGLSTIDIEKIITNLAINAKEAMNECGTLKISLLKKYFQNNWTCANIMMRPGFYVVLRFEDTGCGICNDDLTKIFTPFYTTKTNGNGIGLSTIASLLKDISGNIECKSEVNIGTIFDIYFPIIQATNVTSDAALTNNKQSLLLNKRIILVEDSHDVRDMLTLILKRAGYNILSFGTAEEAISYISTNPIDLVITDANLPNKNGGCVASIAKKNNPNVKIIVISGFDKKRLSQIFPVDSIFISKPIQTQYFLQLVSETLNN